MESHCIQEAANFQSKSFQVQIKGSLIGLWHSATVTFDFATNVVRIKRPFKTLRISLDYFKIGNQEIINLRNGRCYKIRNKEDLDLLDSALRESSPTRQNSDSCDSSQQKTGKERIPCLSRKFKDLHFVGFFNGNTHYIFQDKWSLLNEGLSLQKPHLLKQILGLFSNQLEFNCLNKIALSRTHLFQAVLKAMRITPSLFLFQTRTTVQRMKKFVEFLLVFSSVLFSADALLGQPKAGEQLKGRIGNFMLGISKTTNNVAVSLQSIYFKLQGIFSLTHKVSPKKIKHDLINQFTMTFSDGFILKGNCPSAHLFLHQKDIVILALQPDLQAESNDKDYVSCNRLGEFIIGKIEVGSSLNARETQLLYQYKPWDYISWQGRVQVDFFQNQGQVLQFLVQDQTLSSPDC